MPFLNFAGESLNTPYLSPYLKALGSDFSNGVNFAIGGSTATPGGSPFSLDVQLHQFLYFRTRSFELINKGWLWMMPTLYLTASSLHKRPKFEPIKQQLVVWEKVLYQ
jgi:hypothetical protein